jgi:hypothetical protein
VSASITVRRRDRTAILDVSGDLDLASSPEMRKALLLERRENRTPKVVCNLSQVNYIDSSGIASLVEGSLILGVFDDPPPRDAACTIPLEAGDRVVIYTDGFTESFDSRRRMLGVGGPLEIVRDTAALPLSGMKEEILSRVAGWRTGRPADDMSLVLAQIS